MNTDAASDSGALQKGYAQQRIDWLQEYLAVAERFFVEVSVGAHESSYSKEGKELHLRLEVDRPEAQRILREVDLEREFASEWSHRTVHVLRRGIREWERLRDEVNVRVARLTSFLSRARRVAQLEKENLDDIAKKNANPLDPIVQAGSNMLMAERSSAIREGRDLLTVDQPEIEMLLQDVGNSFARWSFASGIYPGVDFIADQVLQAVGKYRRLTRPPRAIGAVTPPLAGRSIVDAINRALRPAFRDPPETERAVQDQVEQILRVLGVEYHRDKEVAPVGPTSFRPDFTVADQSLAIEVKFANDRHTAAAVQRELAEDVAGYGTKWKHLLAVIYDIGAIQDPDQMRRQNEAHFGVTVLIVKH